MNKETVGITLPEDMVEHCSQLIRQERIESIDQIDLEFFRERLFQDVGKFLQSVHFAATFGSQHSANFFYIDCNICSDDVGHSILVATVLFDIVNKFFFEPALEPKNHSPYTLYQSTSLNKEKLQKAGIRFYSPDEKLGFHNDVLIKGDLYTIPKFISIMNLFLGYDEPGMFYFLPKYSVYGISELASEGVGRVFRFRPTPIVYSSNVESAENNFDWSHVPVVWYDDSGELFLFCNGELQDAEGEYFVARLKDRLLNSSGRMVCPQRCYRILLMRNDNGFHSRDIMKGQYVFEGTTRLMLRAMSKESVRLPV